MMNTPTRRCSFAILALSFCHPIFGWLTPLSHADAARPSQSRSQTIVSNPAFLSATKAPDIAGEDEEWLQDGFEVMQDDENDDDEEDWIPDSVMAEGRKTVKHLRPAKEVIKALPEDDIKSAGATTETKKSAESVHGGRGGSDCSDGR
mmetsp:Transcript_20255/g.31101  ORF Transcript_20255/g.31101 Transcript_20255/m.31101 type:complete len:148 (-) Transcript_20255:81-524(-)